MGISGYFLDLIYLGETSCHHNYSLNSIMTRGVMSWKHASQECEVLICLDIFPRLERAGGHIRSQDDTGRTPNLTTSQN